ncbi:hypothetical protein [Streptomyces sp. HNM0574]|uniref:HEAT repeat domain-containing protein n=1 Tax=Streptomyces sp. HNM0574 TaxID=2714954 RepID=UPI00146A59F8|nr:hypothetical protein [Streptomyces sp. HNM0574]NLU68209.1 hypothetical protein [Streptomyces sp. HNM0574]
MESYYWEGCEPEGSVLRSAFRELDRGESRGKVIESFLFLLRSGDIVAVGIALDYYKVAEISSLRAGSEPGLAEYSQEVLEVARAVLDGGPSSASLSPLVGKGANYASALHVMVNTATLEDVDVLVSHMSDPVSPEVRNLAIEASGGVLWRYEAGDSRLLSVLKGIALGEAEVYVDRVSALGAIGASRLPAAVGALVEATEDADVRIQAHAALQLSEEDIVGEYRNLLENLAENWGDDAPFPAEEVRSALQDD